MTVAGALFLFFQKAKWIWGPGSDGIKRKIIEAPKVWD
jgi:hypothetical protein